MSNLEMKVDALMRLCTAETEEGRAEAMATCRGILDNSIPSATPVAQRNVDATIRRVLLDLGVPDHILGQRYLVAALTLAANDFTAVDKITSYLYPTVAEQYNTTGSRVERAIRHAIELAWDRGDLEILQVYFGNTVSATKGKPTNSEFIARISNVVRAQA